MRILVCILAALLVVGCTTSPIPAHQAKPVPASRVLAFDKPIQGGATLTVVRDSGWLVGGGCFVAILVNGKLAARIDTGESVALHVPAGRNVVGIAADPKGAGLCGLQAGIPLRESATVLESGESQRFRISGDTSSGLDMRPTSI